MRSEDGQAPAASPPQSDAQHSHNNDTRSRWWYLLAVCVAVLAIITLTSWTLHTSVTTSPNDTTLHPAPMQDATIPAPMEVSEHQRAELPRATTFDTITTAAAGTPSAKPTGTVIHPDRDTIGYATPGGGPNTVIPPGQFSSPTWLPVIDTQPEWVRVLLPTRPNNSSAWLYQPDPHLHEAHSPYRITVDRARFTMQLTRDQHPAGRWRIGVGKPSSPTPSGWTFILADVRETHPRFSRLILPLGTHSNVYTHYSDGPGTVGIHTWPNAHVYAASTSDGCIRIPPDALNQLATQIPIGTPVLIK
ncbi:L,D-transpeptidase [Sciscionella marina]|uniref:L,D-transpeptidase n=1 Tax=Sciscionella marina TaxID=508770 RepID=UPI00037EB4DA|nr:L,D-transpeptidase [Sciscionella marina]